MARIDLADGIRIVVLTPATGMTLTVQQNEPPDDVFSHVLCFNYSDGLGNLFSEFALAARVLYAHMDGLQKSQFASHRERLPELIELLQDSEKFTESLRVAVAKSSMLEAIHGNSGT